MADSSTALSYHLAADFLESYGIPVAPAHLVQSASEAVNAAQALGFPVALKALSPHLTHKTERGFVHLHLNTPAEVEEAAQHLLARVAEQPLEGLLVQAMVPEGVEVIVGMSTDRQFGAVIAVGPGGILVELLDDVVLRLPPLTHAQALRMVQQTKAWTLLQGFRGRPPADVDALVRLIVNFSHLAVEQADRLLAVDLNPVIVHPEGAGASVVDVRAFRHDYSELRS